jgi:3-oxoacyl-[acyl-carrier-protein] synthase-3
LTEVIQLMLSSIISALAYEVPSTSLNHAELQCRFGESKMDRLVQSTGIKNRRVCGPGETASDLAFQCANRILSSGDFPRESIDLLIVATQMPDYLLPTTACILQDRLGLGKDCAAFDINLGCSQFVYAHSVAHSMIVAGLAKRALVITCDTPAKIIDHQDMAVVPLFGDGATASILDAEDSGLGYKDFVLGTDGSEHQALIWPGSGLRTVVGEPVDKRLPMTMDGQKIFLFTLQVVPKYIKILLQRNSISPDEVSFFALHQASGLIVSSISRKLGLRENQYNTIYENFGNSGGSTVGISLWHALNDKKIKSNDTVVLSAFGVGLSWANALYLVGKNVPKLY